MTPKHPDAKRSRLDQRFSKVAALAAATRPTESASLRAKDWTTLKEWAVLAFRNSAELGSSPKAMQVALYHSESSEWAAIKKVLVRRNWPLILDELHAWRTINQHII